MSQLGHDSRNTSLADTDTGDRDVRAHRDRNEGQRILLVDAFPIILLGLRRMVSALRPNAAIGCARSIAETRSQVNNQPPVSCVILDLGLPDSTGVETVMRVKDVTPDSALIVFSAEPSSMLREACNDAGATGYLSKATPDARLKIDIARVLDEYVPTHGDTSAESASKPGANLSSLTKRQDDVLALIAQGCSNRAIADKLHISEGTVRTHVVALLRTLKVRNRTAAASLFHRVTQDRVVESNIARK